MMELLLVAWLILGSAAAGAPAAASPPSAALHGARRHPLQVAPAPRPPTCNATTSLGVCGPECIQETQDVLRQLHGLLETNKSRLSNIDGPCLDSDGSPAPGYCCNSRNVVRCCCFGCRGCDKCPYKYAISGLQLRDQGISAPLSDLIPALSALGRRGLTLLSLDGNRLTGPLAPLAAAGAAGALPFLRSLSLGDNRLTGQIPPELGGLTGLEYLAVDANSLTGTVPRALCGAGSKLRDLYLRGNFLEGDVAFDCTGLINLDVQENDLSGPIPASPAWRTLHTLRIGNNTFSSLGEDFYALQSLTILDAMGNRLEGTLAEDIQDLPMLTALYIESNRLAGPLPEGMFHLKRLSYVYAGFNQFTGTLPPHLGNCTGLMGLSLRGNAQLEGPIPESTGRLKHLMIFDIVGTNMHGCRANGSDYPGHKSCLPTFVRFTSREAPPLETLETRGADVLLPMDTLMRCRTIQTNPDDPLGRHMPANTSWQIPPSYFRYKTCSCPDGYRAVWSRARDPEWPDLQCVYNRRAVALGAGLSAGALLLLIAWGWTKFLAAGGFFAVRRYREVLERRMKGMKREGTVSVVVTDIEGYSALMKAQPEAMTAALARHNHAVRKAKWTHCGTTAEQEGDAFLLVFHEAMDAVAFCLQAQQALMAVDWPEELLNPTDDPGAALPARNASASRSRLLSLLGLGRRAASATKELGPAVGPANSAGAPIAPAWSEPGPQGGGRALSESCATGTRGAPGFRPPRMSRLPSWRTLGRGARAPTVATSSLDVVFSQDLDRTPKGRGAAGISDPRAAAAGGGGSGSGAAGVVAGAAAGGAVRFNCGGQQGGKEGDGDAEGFDPGPVTTPPPEFEEAEEGDPLERLVTASGSGTSLGVASSRDGRQRGRGGGDGRAEEEEDEGDAAAVAAMVCAAASGDSFSAGASPTTTYSSPFARGGSASTGGSAGAAAAGAAGAAAAGAAPAGQRAPPLASMTSFAGSRASRGGCASAAHLLAPLGDSPGLFRGLRVRMGVATGPIAAGQDLKATEVWQRAKAVSDAGNGGQTLMDGPTFEAVKDRLQELGAVDAQGLNVALLSHRAKAGWLAWLTLRSASKAAAPEAVILDMGTYRPTANPQARGPSAGGAAAAASIPGTPADGGGGGRSSSSPQSPRGADLPGPGQRRRPSTADGGGGGAFGSVAGAAGGGAAQPLHLLQVLPQCLAGRALVWGNRLALKPEEWEMLDPPYFAAPGTYEAAMADPTLNPESFARAAGSGHGPAGALRRLLRPSQSGGGGGKPAQSGGLLPAAGAGVSVGAEAGGSVLTAIGGLLGLGGIRSPLPPVTAVFIKAEGSKQLSATRSLSMGRFDLGRCHRLLQQCMREALSCVPGGYLVRVQEGDLKYMVVFSNPVAGLEFCLLVQAAALFMPWPTRLLEERACRREDDAEGRVVFRGPRLKMGLREGVPKSIAPDHLGRADFHGDSINMAARFMDAAAHGGQIACDLDTAQAALASWEAHGWGGAASAAAAAATSVAIQMRSFTASSNAQQSGGSSATAGAAGVVRASAGSGGGGRSAAAAGDGDSSGHGGGGGGPKRAASGAVLLPVIEGSGAALPRVARSLSPQQLAGSSPSPAALSPNGSGPASPASSDAGDSVVVRHLGSYQFKGAGDPIPIVTVSLASLAGRAFPEDPPKGKGGRVAARIGIVGTVRVAPPDLAARLKARLPPEALLPPRPAATPPATHAGSFVGRTLSATRVKLGGGSSGGSATAAADMPPGAAARLVMLGKASWLSGGGAGSGSSVGRLALSRSASDRRPPPSPRFGEDRV